MINMFTLDYDMCISTSYTYDIHLRAQIFELTQIIHNTRLYYNLESCINFRKSHQHHPINIWARESLANYLHIVNYCNQLQLELFHRGYQKTHACIDMIRKHNDNIELLKNKFPITTITQYPQFMPTIFYHQNTVIAYRMYYFFFKRYKLPYGCIWTNRDIPKWYNYQFFIQNCAQSVINIIQGPIADFQRRKRSRKKQTNLNK